MSNKILIIGHNGYLGKKIFQNLKINNEVFCLTRKEIKLLLVKGIIELEFEIDVFINCIVSYSNNLADQIESNCYIPMRICGLIKKSKKFKVIHFDSFSSKAYHLASSNNYLFTKSILRKASELYHNNNENITTFVLMLEHIVGKNEKKSKFNGWLIENLKNNNDIVLSKGLQKLDFILVSDIVFLVSILNDTEIFKNEFKIFEVGSGVNHPLRTFVSTIKNKLNSTSIIEFTKVEEEYKLLDSVANNKELLSLGWKPETNLNKIIDLIL